MASLVHLAISALALASTEASQACVAITQVVHELYGDGRLDTNIIRIAKEKIRVDLGRDPDIYQIYRGDSAVLWTVNLKEKTYLRRTGAQIAAMRERYAPVASRARTRYRKAGDGGWVGGWPTEKFAGFRKDQKVAEEWVADAGILGIPEAAARALRDKQGYFDKYSSGWPGKEREHGSGKVGVTVKIISFRDGEPVGRTEYLAVREETCAAGLFEIPPGLDLRTPAKE